MAIDFFGVTLAGRIRQFVPSNGSGPGKTVELWTGDHDSVLTEGLGALSFVSQIDVKYKLGENAVISLTLTPPFEDFQGRIHEVNLTREKLKVHVELFGRETPVEVNFDDVEKIG